MSNLCVFTTVESLASAALLRRSCQRVGIDLQLFGTGTWKGYADGKIRGALDFLRMRTEDVCMFVDGHDSFVLAGEEHILDVYNMFDESIVISCEKTCWPDTAVANRYKKLDTNSPFLYPNAGGWIGERKALCMALRELLPFSEKWPNDDQRCWHEFATDCKNSVQDDEQVSRDTECSIFQAMGGTGEMNETGRNTITGNWPMVWHFNGRTPGREEWYTKLTGDKL